MKVVCPKDKLEFYPFSSLVSALCKETVNRQVNSKTAEKKNGDVLVHLKKHFNMFSKNCQITVVSKHENKTIALEKKLAEVYIILYEKTTTFITWKL